jgi:hypothetical protein
VQGRGRLQDALRLVQYAHATEQARQGHQIAAHGGWQISCECLEFGDVLGVESGMDAGLLRSAQRGGREHGVDHTHIGHVQLKALHTRAAQAGLRELDDFQVGFLACMAVDLGTELQRLTAGQRTIDAGVHHRPAVAQAGHALAVEQMGVDASHLGRAVCAKAQGAAGELIDQFEGLKTEGFTRAGEQGFQVLHQRRHDQLVAIASGRVQQAPAKFFDVTGLGRQDIGNVIREDPGRHGYFQALLKT